MLTQSGYLFNIETSVGIAPDNIEFKSIMDIIFKSRNFKWICYASCKVIIIKNIKYLQQV